MLLSYLQNGKPPLTNQFKHTAGNNQSQSGSQGLRYAQDL